MNKLISFVIVLFLISCSTTENEKKIVDAKEQEIPIKYAKNFKIYKSGSNYRIVIFDRQKVVQEFLVSNQPRDNSVLKIPMNKFVATSTTHLGYIEKLDLRKGLVGFPNTKFISDTLLYNRVKNGEIVELGTAESLNLEKLFVLSPDVIFDFPNPISQGQKAKLKKAGLKTIMITEFYEETALGKAEWIKLFGLLLGKEDSAKKEFDKIEKRFLELKNSISENSLKPAVFSGIMYGDSWYAPGGRSFAAKFYKDAGADFVWKSDTTSGSKSFSFEKVFEDAVDAEYWIGVGGKKSLNDLVESNSNYSLFKAYKNKNIYSVYGGMTAWGANPYFEKGVLEPDVILKDLITIFDKNSDKSKLIYYKKLK